MIITGGENVYPAEIESVLYAHSAIIEVAVIGVPDEKWGEALAAVVVLAPESHLDLQQLRDFAEQKLARYKLPTQLHEVKMLPRNPAGKVQKFIIKEQLMQA
jgi:fatty-acyl-CoA synthase